MLKYALYRNHLTKNEDDYIAKTQSQKNKHIEDIIHQITMAGSILKETECLAVIHDFFEAIGNNLKEGHGFTSEYIRIQASVTGVFHGINDEFDSERHKKQVTISAGNVFKKAVEQSTLEKVEAISRQPEIKSVYDLKSQQTNALLSADHMIELKGSKLKLNLELADEGIFLINTTDDTETKIDHLHTNLPSKLSGMMPETLVPGSYTLEVRNRQEGNKNLSFGMFAKNLIVR